MALFPWLGQQADSLWGSLFGLSAPGAPGSSVYGPPSPYGGTSPYAGGGLLDPAGIRQQAFYQGLGALGSGLIAAGQRRPATQPSLLPQALTAFQPAYRGALQTGYQQAAAERQEVDRERFERMVATLPPEQQAMARGMGPQGWAQYQGQLALPITLGPNQRRIDPATGRVIAEGANQPEWRVGGSAETGFFLYNANAPAGGTPGGAAPSQQQGGSAPGGGTPALPGPHGAVLGQLRQAESGGRDGEISRYPPGHARAGQPIAYGRYQFTPATWAGVSRAHPELNLTPDGIYNGDQQDRAAQAHAGDIVRQLGGYIGRTFNGQTITADMLIRGAWAGGIEGMRRYIESGGRYNPADTNGTTIGSYFSGTARNLQGGRGGGSQGAGDATPVDVPGSYVAGARSGMPPQITQGQDAPTGAVAGLPQPIAGGPAAEMWARARTPPPAAAPAAPAAPSSMYPPGVIPVTLPRQQSGFAGNSLEAQAWNIVNAPNPDRSSREYGSAYSILTEPRPQQVPDPNNPAALVTVMVPRQLPAHVLPPTPRGQAGAPAEQAAPAQQPGPQQVPGSSQVPPATRERVRVAEAEGNRVLDAVNNFERIATAARGTTRFNTWLRNPLSPEASEYQQAYENMVVALRGESFMNTGVLQTSEGAMLADRLRDPSSFRGALMDSESRSRQLAQIRTFVQQHINRQRQSIGLPPLEFPAAGSGAPGGTGRVIQYDERGNRIEGTRQ